MPADIIPPTAPGLMAAFNFTPDDLQANRTGTLSEHQRETLPARQPGLDNRAALLYLGIAVALALVNLFANRTLLTIAGVFFTFSGLLGLLDYAYRRYRVRQDAKRGVVASVTGPTYRSRALRRQASPTLTIGDQTFMISAAAWEAVPDGEPHTVYYTPGARIIVAAEAA